MKFFLKLKHWQLFGLTFGVLFVFQIIAMIDVFTENVAFLHNPKTESFVVLLLSILSFGTFFGWLYALGINLNKKLPDTVKMNLKKFKYSFNCVVFLSGIFIGYILAGGWSNSDLYITSYPWIISLPGFLAMICIFYCFYFIAKSFKAVELQRPVTYSDYGNGIFLIWFFPIGVWIIQPRINKIFEEKEEVQT